MTSHLHTTPASAPLPANDEGPTVAAVAPQISKQDKSADFRCARPAAQAELHDEGEAYGREYLTRLQGGTAGPGELAVIVVFLRGGPMLEGICSAIERALEGTHHA